MPVPTVPFNLALQGGGAHGAFTWGVLDRLLEAGARLGTISATSAGAVNAVALSEGLREGGPSRARQKLRAVWEAINRAGMPDFLWLNPLLMGLRGLSPLSGRQVANLASLLSPAGLDPFDLNPLRRLLLEHIDFAGLAGSSPVPLLLAATDVATGRAKLFRTDEISVEVVLASACLPTLHRPVEIGGRHYWDGGYSANPAILPLAFEAPAHDTLIVLLNPTDEKDVPRETGEIAGRMSRITFNQPFLADVARLALIREAGTGLRGLLAPAPLRRAARHRFHLIEAAAYTARLPPGSKLKPDWGLLQHLLEAGRTEAGRWIDGPARAVGRGEGVDLEERFLPVLADA